MLRAPARAQERAQARRAHHDAAGKSTSSQPRDDVRLEPQHQADASKRKIKELFLLSKAHWW